VNVADFSAFLAAIGSAGPWVLLVAVLVLFCGVIVVGAIKKAWVLGWMYEDIEKRLAESIRVNEALSATNRELTDIVTTALVRRDDWMDRADGGRRSTPERRGPHGQGYSDHAPRR
jgi:hypothetical protein